MIEDIQKYLAVFFSGFVVTYVLTPWVREAAWRLGIVDQPSDRRLHDSPTPRGGGIAVAVGVHAACLMAFLLPWAQYAREFSFGWWKSYAIASLILILLGVIDDVRGLRALTKLIGQILAATVVYYSGARIGSVFGWEVPPWLSYSLTVLWLLAVINAFNLIDGLDGLACGLAFTSALGLCAILVLLRAPGDTLVLLGLAGACLAFLRYNFHPASIFLGDTGSMFLGLTLGAFSLKTFTSGTFVLSLAIPLFVLGVPLFDTLLAVWRRSVRLWMFDPTSPGHDRKGIMAADAEHLHHRLLKAGWNTRRVATVLWGANASLVGMGILITGFQSYAAGIVMVAMVAGMHLLLRHVAVIELVDTGKAVLRGFRRPNRRLIDLLLYPAWDVTWLALALAIAAVLAPGGEKKSPWETWLLALPTWVIPTFAMLVAFRSYQVVWARALAKDLLTLWLGLWLGLAWSMTTAVLLDPSQIQRVWLWAFIVGGISHLAIILSRLSYRCAEEMVPWLLQKNGKHAAAERVLLYGAGGRCQLYLKERGFAGRNQSDGRYVVGLIDDDAALRYRFVYGYKVLGTRLDVPRLVRQHGVKVVVITAKLSSESRATIEKTAEELGLTLTEWNFEERPLVNGNGHVSAMNGHLPGQNGENGGPAAANF